MTQLSEVRGVLLDIEGTTSSIRFVYDVMFPFVRSHLDAFLKEHWETESCQACLPLIAVDVQEDPDQWLVGLDLEQQQRKVAESVVGMMDNDIKATGLKQLQGLIWKSGFQSGEMVAHLYDDVAPAIQQWRATDKDVRIYSSGSIGAQKLFFGHTVAGDLLSKLGGHYDTTTGPKRESESYRKIADDFDCPAEQILFVSDVLAELDAARDAKMQTALSVRPGNEPVPEPHDHRVIKSFDEL
ncbi:MAG: acireductone synthase [Planctomycetota bacterium]